jgi:hypothetical protein
MNPKIELIKVEVGLEKHFEKDSHNGKQLEVIL